MNEWQKRQFSRKRYYDQCKMLHKHDQDLAEQTSAATILLSLKASTTTLESPSKKRKLIC
jgi:hypothetical protein